MIKNWKNNKNNMNKNNKKIWLKIKNKKLILQNNN